MSIKNFVQDHSQGVAETIKLSPPVAITATSAGGIEWQTWVVIGTLIYTGLLILHKVIQIVREVKKFNRKTDAESTQGDA